MEMTNTKKKLMLAAIMTSGLTLAISQAAMAAPDQNMPAVQKEKAATAVSCPKMNPEMKLAHDKFLNETVALRKEMAEKKAVMRALINADTPDTTKVAQLAGELFDLREKLRVKAQEAGLPMHMGHGGGWDGHDDGRRHGRHHAM